LILSSKQSESYFEFSVSSFEQNCY